MTKMFRNLRKHEANLKKLLAENECGVTIDDYNYGDNNFVVDAACRMVRLLAVRMGKVKETIAPHLDGDTSRKIFGGNMPVMIFDEQQIGYVRVFTNLSVDSFTVEAARDCTRYTHADDLLKTFMEGLFNDTKDERRKQAWIGSGRAWKRMKRSETIPLTRALSRFLGLGDWPDHKLRNLATAIEEDLKPLALLYADDPKDFQEMYGEGPTSCMDMRHKDTWPELNKADSHPCAFFAYWPHTRGVYAKRKGKVMARTIVYEREPGVWCYGRVYANHEQDRKVFMEQLHKDGFKPLDPNWKEGDNKFRHGYYRGAPAGMEKSVFTIPGIISDSGKYCMPVPYFDNIGTDPNTRTGYCQIFASFDKETKTFTVEIGPNVKGNVSTTLQNGRVFSNQLSTKVCVVCGRNYEEGLKHQTRDRDYCSRRCVEHDGCCQAYRSDGMQVIVDRDGAYKDPFNGDWYTNERAAIDFGAKPARLSPFFVEEFEEVTRGGRLMKEDDKPYMLEPYVAEALAHLRRTSTVFKAGVVTAKLPMEQIEVKVQRNVIVDLDDLKPKIIGDIPDFHIEEAPEEVVKPAKAKIRKAKDASEDFSFDPAKYGVSAGVKIVYEVMEQTGPVVNIRRA